MKGKTTEVRPMSEARPDFLESLKEYQLAASSLASLVGMCLEEGSRVSIPEPVRVRLQEALNRFNRA